MPLWSGKGRPPQGRRLTQLFLLGFPSSRLVRAAQVPLLRIIFLRCAHACTVAQGLGAAIIKTLIVDSCFCFCQSLPRRALLPYFEGVPQRQPAITQRLSPHSWPETEAIAMPMVHHPFGAQTNWLVYFRKL